MFRPIDGVPIFTILSLAVAVVALVINKSRWVRILVTAAGILMILAISCLVGQVFFELYNEVGT